jgi:hypothetical protein
VAIEAALRVHDRVEPGLQCHPKHFTPEPGVKARPSFLFLVGCAGWERLVVWPVREFTHYMEVLDPGDRWSRQLSALVEQLTRA